MSESLLTPKGSASHQGSVVWNVVAPCRWRRCSACSIGCGARRSGDGLDMHCELATPAADAEASV